jgi:hypothetical protein
MMAILKNGCSFQFTISCKKTITIEWLGHRLGKLDIVVRLPARAEICLFLTARPDRLWSPSSILYNVYRGLMVGHEADHSSPPSEETYLNVLPPHSSVETHENQQRAESAYPVSRMPSETTSSRIRYRNFNHYMTWTSKMRTEILQWGKKEQCHWFFRVVSYSVGPRFSCCRETSFSWYSLVPEGKRRNSASNYATTASLPILSNSLFTVIQSLDPT